MLTILLNHEEAVPLYQQIYLGIRSEIEQGSLLPDEKLPSKRSLAVHLQVSTVTVQAAYDQLVAEGYLITKPRSGYYVAEDLNLLLPGQHTELHFTSKQNAVSVSASEQPELVRFSTGGVDTQQFPFSTWAKLSRQVLATCQDHLLDAMPPCGIWELRCAIAKHLYAYRHMQVQPEQLIIGAGSEYLIGLLVQLLGRERRYAVEDPGYRKTMRVFTANGAAVDPVSVDADGMQVEQLARTAASVAHVTPSHHFPTGIVMPLKRRLELLQWAEQCPGRYILEEEYDSELQFTSAPVSALQSLDYSGSVVYLNTFAKTLAPSFRISYMVLPPQLLQQYQQQLAFYACTVPSLEQYTLVRFLQEGYFERHLNRMKKIYRKRRDSLLAVIQQHALVDALRISGAAAGPHFLLEVHTGQSEERLIALARQVGVEVHGLSEFYQAPSLQQHPPTLVIGYACLEEETMRQGAKAMLDQWAAHLTETKFQ